MLPAMDQAEIVEQLEARARALGLPMCEVCRRAGVAASTPSRWKGPKPIGMMFATLRKLTAVLDNAEAEAALARAA